MTYKWRIYNEVTYLIFKGEPNTNVVSKKVENVETVPSEYFIWLLKISISHHTKKALLFFESELLRAPNNLDMLFSNEEHKHR